MADKGIRGFFIHSRQGLGQPYLSQAFFDKVKVAVEAARARGLIVHLYDEFPYPSGVAGGEVVLGNPQYHATRLTQTTHDVEGGPLHLELPAGRVLEIRAFPLRDGAPDWGAGIDLRDQVGMVLSRNTYIEGRMLSAYNFKRYWAGRPVPVLEAVLPEGRHRIFASIQAEVRNHKYWGGYVDVYNREAIQHFLRLTHERYRERMGDDFGTVIRSIYVDETGPARWSPIFIEAFRTEYGYDICDRLHVLQAPEHPDHKQVRFDLERLKYRLFCESFEQPYSAWCREHGLAYAGEKPSLRFSQLNYMDIPGCDAGHTKAGAPLKLLGSAPRGNARLAASAAYFYGKCGALCECYHSIGWSATLQDAKLIAEGLLLCGIRYLVPHGFFYSTHALRKHDAAPSFFWQMPYWPFFGNLAKRLSRIAEHFEATWIDAEVLLIDPGSGIPTNDDLAVNAAIHQALMARHLDYLVVDTDILQGGRIEDGRVRIRDINARVVILPPMQVVEAPLETWLDTFERAGGVVLRCDADVGVDDLCNSVAGVVEPSLHLQCDGGDGGRVWMVRRASADRTVWFLVNTSDEAMDLAISSPVHLREVSLGDAPSHALRKAENGYHRRIAPFESFLIEAVDQTAVAEELPRIAVPVDGSAEVRALNANLLRLYDWRMTLLDGADAPAETVTVPAVPIGNQLALTKQPFAPAIHIMMSGETQFALPPLRVRYECAFENTFAGPVELVIEPGSIVGDWRISINNGVPLVVADLVPTDAHIRGSLGADVTPRLREGKNRICVEVLADRADGGLLNALYLAGAFGVRLDPPTLTDPVETGVFEDYEGNLLPYYAGAVEYRTTFNLEEPPGAGDVLVELAYKRPFREAGEVSINGSPFQPVLWEPRRLRLPAETLRAGENEMTTRVHTSLIRAFEGQWFDPATHSLRDVGA